MADKPSGGWPQVVKAALWPVFALVIIGIFFAPISNLLRNTNDSGMVVQELEVGTLKLKLSPSGVARLPTPTPDLANRLTRLEPADIETLISWPAGVMGMDSCVEMAPPGHRAWEPLSRQYQERRFKDWQVDRKLADLGFFLIRPHERHGSVCIVQGFLTLTDDGRKAREFLLDLAANAIQLSSK